MYLGSTLTFQKCTTKQFQCCECFHIGALYINEYCHNCGSSRVISQELLSSHDKEHDLPLARIASAPTIVKAQSRASAVFRSCGELANETTCNREQE